MSRLKKILLLLTAVLLFLGIYVIDVVRNAVSLGGSAWLSVREIAVFVSFVLLFVFIQGARALRQTSVPKNIGQLLAYSIFVLAFVGLIVFLGKGSTDANGEIPTSPGAIATLFSSLTAIALGLFSIITLLTIRDLIFYKRKKGTKRNFLAYAVSLVVANTAALPLLPGESQLLASLLFSVTVVLIVVNSFKQNWVVYLSRR
jgi:hypothetical protein